MASKDAFYIKHDYNAASDPEIVRLIMAGGVEAYGIFWRVVEMIYNENGATPFDIPLIAFMVPAAVEKVERVVKSKLFYIEAGMLRSKSADRRLDERRAASMAASAAAVNRWNAEAMRPHSGPNARRGEERRGKDITAADGSPSAADLSKKIDDGLKAQDQTLFLSRMEDARLPFDFGDFKKGGRINDLPAETCALVLERVPRLGLDLRRFLQIKIDEKKADSARRKA